METKTSPIAEAMYPFVVVPDTRFNPEGTYSIDLRLDPKENKDHNLFLGNLKKSFESCVGKNKPYKPEIDKASEESTGLWIVKFKSKFGVKLFDSKGTLMDGTRKHNFIGNESKIKISYTEGTYTQNGGGLSLYLQAVQVIVLIEWDGGNAEDYGFGEEKGYVEEDTKTEETKSAEKKCNEVFGKKEELEEDVPF